MLLAIATIILFAALAGAAFRATHREPDLFWLGAWLVLGFLGSNVVHFAALEYAKVPVLWKPGPYTFFEIMVAVAASCALVVHRHDRRMYWGLVGILCCNVLSICANFAIGWIGTNNVPDPRQVFLFELTTNLTFGLECLLATGVGIVSSGRPVHFGPWPHRRRTSAAAGAACARTDRAP